MLTLPLPINTNTHHARDSYKPSAHGAYRIIRVLIGVNLYCRGLFFMSLPVGRGDNLSPTDS